MRAILTDSTPVEEFTREVFEVEALQWRLEVHRFALSMARDETEAEDIVQETYFRAFRSWQTFVVGSDCRRWLFAICRNVFIRNYDRRKRWVFVDTNERMDDVMSDARSVSGWDDRGADQFATFDVASAIQEAVAGVPEPFRSAITAVDLDDQSYEAAAEQLGVPIGTVRSRLFRGRRLLQEQLRCHAVDLGVVTASDEPQLVTT